ncbi:hypothetical protein ACQEWB_18715 [Streptomyces sp. CA-249302]|uniref:hypothetical protein n=1 Tax=Streptomyces sp. CA-249302 TaxID=3240058 RepID=UPI003D8A71BA
MRLSKPTFLCLAAAAAALLPVPPPASAAPAPTCAAPDGRGFPLTTRIHDAPADYEAGGGYGTWYLDLTNTTTRTCAAIHPVVVLVDAKRALKPSQPRLEFYDGPRTHPVHFEPTDEAELVGAFDDGFPGFTVGPGKTLTVKVRLALTSGAVPNEVTVNAAVVQRHDDDGDWVGQSNDYRFRVSDAPLPDTTPTGTAPPAPTGPSPSPTNSPARGSPPPPSPPPPPGSSSVAPCSCWRDAGAAEPRRGKQPEVGHSLKIRPLFRVGPTQHRVHAYGRRSRTCQNAGPSSRGSPTWTVCSSTRAYRSPAPTPS